MALRLAVVGAFCLMLSGVEAQTATPTPTAVRLIPLCKFHPSQSKKSKPPKQQLELACSLMEEVREKIEEGKTSLKHHCIGMCANGGTAATYDFGTAEGGQVCDVHPDFGDIDVTTFFDGCTPTTTITPVPAADVADESRSSNAVPGTAAVGLATMEHDDGSITWGMAAISGFLGLIGVILAGHVYMLHKLTKSVAKASLD